MPDPATLPKHLLIAEALIRDIHAGRLLDGERLPPEREMATGLAVAVGTLRKALAELEGQGMLTRRQGSGNYVRHRDGPAGVYGFFRLELHDGGGMPTADILSAETGRFGFDPGHRVRRLRRLDGVAVAVEEILIDATIVPDLAGLGASLDWHYRQAAGVLIARVEDRIGTGARPGWAAAQLPPGTHGLVARTARDGTGRIVETSRTWFDSGKAAYVNRMH
jgi:GntR family transcriptional regulator